MSKLTAQTAMLVVDTMDPSERLILARMLTKKYVNEQHLEVNKQRAISEKDILKRQIIEGSIKNAQKRNARKNGK